MSNKYPGGFVSLGGQVPSYSVLSNGSSQYLTVANNAAFLFGSSAFTIEGWYYPTTVGVYQALSCVWDDSNNAGQSWTFIVNSNNTMSFYVDIAAADVLIFTSTKTIAASQWNHLAITRSGNTFYLFINGILDSTATNSGTISSGSASLGIGGFSASTSGNKASFYGYISNYRIVKGTALYTSNFILPTGPLTNLSGTSLLTCQSATIVDNSSNNFTVTNNGAATVSTLQPNFQSYNPNNLDPALGASTPGMWTLSQALNAEVTRSWPMYDPYYKNVVLNLHGEGTNGAQNNTFLDSSTNNFTITRNGNTTQGTFSPYGQGWSNYFLPSTASIDFPTTSNLNLTGNFTIDFWFNLSSIPATGYIFSGTAFTIQFVTSNLICFDGATNQPILTAPSANTWYYISLVRSGTTVTPYVNGIAGTSFTNSSTTVFTHSAGRLGAAISSGANPITGYLSNYRVSNTARTISLQTTPPTQDANTLALVCASNRFNDLGINNLSLTVGSGVSVQRFQPFLFNTSYTPSTIGGSGYFDGSGDYLSIANNAAFQFGTGDFTIECWVNKPSAINGAIVDARSPLGAVPWALYVDGSNLPYFYDGTQYTSSVAIINNAWNHVVVVRTSGVLKIFVNGVQGYSASHTISLNASGSLTIGGTAAYSTGYISDLRIVKGTAVYTSAFTPPTAPLTAITNTSLLTNFTNAGIVDNAMMNDLETVGNAQISTSVKKYGTGSMYFDGTGDYLQGPHTVNAEFGKGDFTVEFWAYIVAQSGTYTGVVGQWLGGSASSANSWNMSINAYNATNKLGFTYSDGSTNTDLSFGSALGTGTWNHYAVCRSGNLLYAFKDGVLLNSGGTSITATINNGTSALRVGSIGTSGGGSDFNGYIDDLRITKGVARYVANFTPPTSQLQDQ